MVEKHIGHQICPTTNVINCIHPLELPADSTHVPTHLYNQIKGTTNAFHIPIEKPHWSDSA